MILNLTLMSAKMKSISRHPPPHLLLQLEALKAVQGAIFIKKLHEKYKQSRVTSAISVLPSALRKSHKLQ
jgi:hypothetical protein